MTMIDIDAGVVRRVSEEVSERLAAEAETDRQLRTDPIIREARAAVLINESLDRLARDRLDEGGTPLDAAEEDELAARVRAQLFGLAELERLVSDDTVENVFCNGWDTVLRRHSTGLREQVDPITADDEALTELLRQAAATQGRTERRFDTGRPWVSFRLADGSRLTAVREVSGRTIFALRRHRHSDVTIADLHRLGSVSDLLASLLPAAVRSRRNLMIVGGTDAGKTTLLRALLNEVPSGERLVTVEDALELQLSRHPERHPDLVELECREENIEGRGEVTMRDLTRLALRLSPDRVIVGEARGPEILDMFQAMSQGNDGSMGTLHARSTADAFVQIMRYALKAPERLSPEAVAVDIAASLDLIVHVAKTKDDRRAVTSVREVVGHDGAMVLSNEVLGPDEFRRAIPTGRPFQDATLDALVEAGFEPGLLDSSGGWNW
ncbi:MAG TPA: ATPase, T2SS/T4P/T4SS family [Candidatus Limnocylindria bacterium]